jgi:hypothetical protein
LAAKSRDSLYLIDSTIVKAHRAASGAKVGEKSGNRGLPRRALNEKPTPLLTARASRCFAVTGDGSTTAKALVEVLDTPKPPLAITADKAYDSVKVRQQIKDDALLPSEITARIERQDYMQETCGVPAANAAQRLAYRVDDTSEKSRDGKRADASRPGGCPDQSERPRGEPS